ncbi:Z1 domain containing protein [Pyrenophora tritici-repentis]|uniref:Z1 domain containing protein n=1 Tax=Pyrenophora tritici-repentis TaxID=45151 RepID=A0A2W1FE02_9PLEO|nr:hypothetical protein PtrV1_02930 [Pyrenophora tritici-repentis]KAF7442726.1 hypothetical protein A1F99_135950 [Pyrenophora tritici-repentis]KAF7578894.1 Z1 domain containing protein [Pyrenophora tritici-repentis]KAI0569961.1 hypothetical protein Alg215_11348 [Pyrenophora tritici-repentis]KAI1512773.1 hypothetical protein Ptr86124_007793 [Pyrenophora tritici-repentis]
MSTSQADVVQRQHVTPPPSLTDQPLTPPLTDKKPFAGALHVIALFREIQQGRNTTRDTQIEFELAEGEYDHIERTLQQDHVLWGYVQDKIRYDYDEDQCRLVVRMPTETHELFIDAVEDDIRSQLKKIRNGSGKQAEFAQKVRPARSTEIRFDTSALSSKSKYEPDASFKHKDAQYPGVIIEVAYSQKKKRLVRLAENYLLDSDANVRVVVGLDIAYGKESRKATLSLWRPQLFDTPDGPELRAVDMVVDEAFRDDEGNPVDHPGIQLRLSDFTSKGLARKEIGDEDADICISGIQLCRYIDAAESNVRRALWTESLDNNVKKRKRSETPPEEIQSSDEAKYAKQEERAAKRTDCDTDYQDKSSTKSLSD